MYVKLRQNCPRYASCPQAQRVEYCWKRSS